MTENTRNRVITIIEWTYAVVLIFFIAVNAVVGNYAVGMAHSVTLVWVALAMNYRLRKNKLSKILDDTFKNTDNLFNTLKVMIKDSAYLLGRVEGLYKAVRRAAAARKADREKLRRIVEVANAIDREMTPNDSFNQEKIRWASAIRNIAYGRTANV